MANPSLVRALAGSFLAGEQTVEAIVARSSQMLGEKSDWLRPLAQRYIQVFAGAADPRPRRRDVVQFLQHDEDFNNVGVPRRIAVAHWLTGPQRMQPVAAAETWEVPAIESIGALAEWLTLTPGELEWFADLKGLGYKQRNPRLQHYHYRLLAKPSGEIRLIEAPKERLKELQRKILREILEKIPPHRAVHGFIRGRSIQTFARQHVDQRVVLRMDVRNFFPSFAAARIQSLFRTIGYPERVADLLGGICTNATPRNIWHKGMWHKSAAEADPQRFRQAWTEARAFYAQPHLPQGAPSSPALANLCAYRMDCRLTGLAKSAGCVYTRYADDLAFSGDKDFELCVERFSTHAASILLEEGFEVHHRKTRIMRQGVRQHLAGLVVNRRVNVRRTDFDLLKAILTNCVRLGPESQNRDVHPHFRAHLEGRVGFVEMVNPAKAKRLRAIFEQIRWP